MRGIAWRQLMHLSFVILQPLALILCWTLASPAWAADPIKVGFSLGMTGANGPNGKQLIIALEIWRDDVNAKGGLLGRPAELVYYDDPASPRIAPPRPVTAPHKQTPIGMLGLASNAQAHYKNYFSMLSYGQDPAHEFSRGFFEFGHAKKLTKRALV